MQNKRNIKHPLQKRGKVVNRSVSWETPPPTEEEIITQFSVLVEKWRLSKMIEPSDYENYSSLLDSKFLSPQQTKKLIKGFKDTASESEFLLFESLRKNGGDPTSQPSSSMDFPSQGNEGMQGNEDMQSTFDDPDEDEEGEEILLIAPPTLKKRNKKVKKSKRKKIRNEVASASSPSNEDPVISPPTPLPTDILMAEHRSKFYHLFDLKFLVDNPKDNK